MTYREQLKDWRWQKRRLEICERDSRDGAWTCRFCYNDLLKNKKLFPNSNGFHVHHLDYIDGLPPWEYDGIYLITLCEVCHGMAYKSHVLNTIILEKFQNRLAKLKDEQRKQEAAERARIEEQAKLKDMDLISALRYRLEKAESEYQLQHRDVEQLRDLNRENRFWDEFYKISELEDSNPTHGKTHETQLSIHEMNLIKISEMLYNHTPEITAIINSIQRFQQDGVVYKRDNGEVISLQTILFETITSGELAKCVNVIDFEIEHSRYLISLQRRATAMLNSWNRAKANQR